MRICKPIEAGLIFGQGSPSMMGINWSGFTYVPPATAPGALPLETLQQATSPTFTSSMPSTTNPTVSITTGPSDTIYTTITLPSSTQLGPTTNLGVATSTPSTLNPTSNAQTSTPDKQNTGPGVETGIAIAIVGEVVGNVVGGGIGRAIGNVVAEHGISIAINALNTSPATQSNVTAFGHDGLNNFGNFGFATTSGALGSGTFGMDIGGGVATGTADSGMCSASDYN
jgi:hypothetical protein